MTGNYDSMNEQQNNEEFRSNTTDNLAMMAKYDSVGEKNYSEDIPLLDHETGSKSNKHNVSVRRIITTVLVMIAFFGASLLLCKSTEEGRSSFKSGNPSFFSSVMLSLNYSGYHYLDVCNKICT